MDLDVENTETAPLTVTLEPWAEEHILAVGERLRLSFNGETEGIPLIARSPSGLTIYGWPGSTVAVYRNGSAIPTAGYIAAPTS
jgi:hypothetical protein